MGSGEHKRNGAYVQERLPHDRPQDRVMNTLPWTVREMHRSSEVQILDARGRLVAIVQSKDDAALIVRAVNHVMAAAPARL